MIELTQAEHRYLEIFKQHKTLFEAVANSSFKESTFKTYFNRLKTKGLIEGTIIKYSFPKVEFAVSVANKSCRKQRLNHHREITSRIIKRDKKETAIDAGFHFIDGKRVEHPINLKPLVFENGRIRNVYPEFSKVS